MLVLPPSGILLFITNAACFVMHKESSGGRHMEKPSPPAWAAG